MTKARIPTTIEQLTHSQREAYNKLDDEWASAAEVAGRMGLPRRYNAGTALSLNRIAAGGLIERSHDARPVIGTVYRRNQP